MDIVTSTQACVGTVAVTLGVQYSLAADPTFDPTGLGDMWTEAIVNGETDPVVLESAYGGEALAPAVRGESARNSNPCYVALLAWVPS